MTDTKFDESGKVVKIPYTIATSASRIPNGGKAKDLTFLELSEKRAESVKNYLQQVFSSAGVKMIEPIVSFQGDGKTRYQGRSTVACYLYFRVGLVKMLINPNYDKFKLGLRTKAVAFNSSSPGLEQEILGQAIVLNFLGLLPFLGFDCGSSQFDILVISFFQGLFFV